MRVRSGAPRPFLEFRVGGFRPTLQSRPRHPAVLLLGSPAVSALTAVLALRR
ncbi:hypothetical protein [Kitasatospora sp. NPDC127116]|uniref:hypothetical protein n=1 Tax=Kitasatospora sp. NPDC127116 TaxID=3345367 RepID=UPI0036345A50